MRLLLAVLALLLLAGPAHAAGITDLGNGTAVDVNAHGEVLLGDAVMIDGVIRTPSNGTFYAQSLSESGIAVGSADGKPAYWDTLHATAYVPISIAGVTAADGHAITTGYCSYVNAAGEAYGPAWYDDQFGSRHYANFRTSATNGLPSTAAESASFFPASARWGVTFDTERQAVLLDRTTNASTPTGLYGNEAVHTAFAEDGTTVGYRNGPNTTAIRLPNGTVNDFSAPANSNAIAEAVNTDHTTVGYIVTYDESNGHQQGVSWSATGEATPLIDAAATADGWTGLTPYAIDEEGDVVGYGVRNGQGRAFLLHLADPDLTAKVEATDPTGAPLTGQGTSLGSPVRVRVTLTAPASAKAPVEHVKAAPPVVDPDGALMLTGSPSQPADGVTLQPGTSVTYDYTYTVAASGHATVSVHATGDEDGDDLEADASAPVQLGQPFKVEVSFQQNGKDVPNNTIKLADDDNGELPQDVTAVVKVTNISGVVQDEVRLADQPDLSVLDPNSDHVPFPLAAKGAPSPAELGSIQPGQSLLATIPLTALRNNDVHVSQLVTSSAHDRGDTEKSFGAGDLHILPTAVLLVGLKPNASTPANIKTGRTVILDGTVTNLSSTHKLDLDPLLATTVGNGGDVTADDGATPTADGFLAPVTGEMKPAEKKSFHVYVQTVQGGGTRATSTLAPAGALVGGDGAHTALGASDIRVTAGSSPLILHLNDSDPVDDPVDEDTASYIFNASMLSNLQLWAAEGFHAATDLRGAFTTLGGGLVATGGLVVHDAQAFRGVYELTRAELGLHVFWSSLSAAQKQQFEDEVALDVGAAKDSWKQFHGSVDAAVQDYFQSFQDHFQKGDVAGAEAILGAGVGHGLPEGLSLLVPDVILAKVARGFGWGLKVAGGLKEAQYARLVSLGEKIKTSGIVLKAAKGLEGVEVGQNLLKKSAKILKEQFGLSAADIKAFQYWAKKNNLLIAIRQRSPISLHWIEKFKAVLKPELIKVKNVDAIDVAYLGYRDADEGSVVLREPIDRKLFQRRVAGLDADTRKAVAKRYGQRAKEWKKHEKEYKAWDRTEQDLGFDKIAQGGKSKKKAKLRRFELERIHGAKIGGDQYFVVKIADQGGTMRRVTGDIDIVAITLADGRVPSAEVREKLYDDLMEAVGMQHGETLSWILKGELLSKTKAGLLADHLPGREILAVFGPDGGARAAYFEPRLTVFNQSTKEIAATFVGAYSSSLEHVGRYVAVSLARFF